MCGQIVYLSVLSFDNDHRVGSCIDSGPQSVRLSFSGSSVLCCPRLSHWHSIIADPCQHCHRLSSLLLHYWLVTWKLCITLLGPNKTNKLQSTFTVENASIAIDIIIVTLSNDGYLCDTCDCRFWGFWIVSHPAAVFMEYYFETTIKCLCLNKL
jgi:hypothetical protein